MWELLAGGRICIGGSKIRAIATLWRRRDDLNNTTRSLTTPAINLSPPTPIAASSAEVMRSPTTPALNLDTANPILTLNAGGILCSSGMV
ncbi:MAG TPA: hypothetical protein V6D12_23015 [Candidatus Obscuribacterales bacterium]